MRDHCSAVRLRRLPHPQFPKLDRTPLDPGPNHQRQSYGQKNFLSFSPRPLGGVDRQKELSAQPRATENLCPQQTETRTHGQCGPGSKQVAVITTTKGQPVGTGAVRNVTSTTPCMPGTPCTNETFPQDEPPRSRQKHAQSLQLT